MACKILVVSEILDVSTKRQFLLMSCSVFCVLACFSHLCGDWEPGAQLGRYHEIPQEIPLLR